MSDGELQPYDLLDRFKGCVWTSGLEEGKLYTGNAVCGDFKKENGKVWLRYPHLKTWTEVNPHPRSIFKEIGV